MRIERHVAVSTVISGILYALFKSWGLTIASFFAGTIIDLDHLIDYLFERGLCLNIKDFLSFFYEEKHRKITLIFHSWELLIVLFIFTKITNYNPWISGLTIGYAQHIILDYLYSKTYFKTYSLLWRWKKGFDSEILFPRNRGYNPKA